MTSGDRDEARRATEAGGRRGVATTAGAAAIALATLGLAPPPAGTGPAALGEGLGEGHAPATPGATATPPPDDGAFDRAAALSEMRRLGRSGSWCGHGATGPDEAIVFVTFGPSGEVARVRVDAAVPRSIAACLRAVFRDARVPPFRGAAWPVRHRVTLL